MTSDKVMLSEMKEFIFQTKNQYVTYHFFQRDKHLRSKKWPIILYICFTTFSEYECDKKGQKQHCYNKLWWKWRTRVYQKKKKKKVLFLKSMGGLLSGVNFALS